ncbi:MAG: peptide chain release factor 1 [Chloroflexi bacterium]|nr:peptide chain release factor 1 [Chloroflexota bacterium]
MLDRLAEIEKRYDELTHLMAQPEVATNPEQLAKYAREQIDLEPLVSTYRQYRTVERELAEAEALLDEESDEAMRRLAREEVETLKDRRQQLAEAIKRLLLPKDPNDERNVIVEIRAAAGGDEAGLFAADLYRMYSRYAQSRGWAVDVIDANQSGIGGFKEIIFEIKGRGAYSRLKYESGAHRVQRVPLTEASGRIHTSTATVAVLPEVEDVDVHVNPDDLKIDIYHASGHGGQNVQKVATAVRITHLPTSMVVACQDERSQLQNKLRALAVLRARLYDMEQQKIIAERAESRRAQVGTGDRSEKIRTYNFPQNRVTDHRVDLSIHNLPAVLEGDLDAIIDAVATADQAARLQAAGAGP